MSATPAVSKATVSADEIFKVLLQDSNGSDVYSSLNVQLGYIESAKFLVVTESFVKIIGAATSGFIDTKVSEIEKMKIVEYDDVAKKAAYVANYPYKNSLAALGKASPDKLELEIFKIQVLNYSKLLSAGLTSDSAMYCATYRARLCALGAFGALRKSTKAGEDEYVIVNNTSSDADTAAVCNATSKDAVLDAVPTVKTAFLTTKFLELNRWIISTAEHLLAATEYVFRVRGHHFKSKGKDADEYKDLYGRFLNASFEGGLTIPTGFSFVDMFHTAIHPFKLEPLVQMVHHFAMHGKLAAAAMIRFAGAPTGQAALTTTCAALQTMAGETWYKSFEKVYQREVDMVTAARDAIVAARYSYHQSAGYYGVAKRMDFDFKGTKKTLENAKAECSNVASACQGLINALDSVMESNMIKGFALKNAKALQKASQANPLLSLKVSQIVLKSIQEINEGESANKISEAVFKALTDAKAAAPAVAAP